MRQGWVSVVIPTYNRASRLAASVNSCLEQTHDQVEVIVVDDGSTDETPELLAELQARWGSERFQSVRQANQGAPVARNAGMGLARGEYLQLLDSDDLLTPGKFALQIAALERTGADCAVCDVLMVQDDAAHTPVRQILYDHDLRAGLARFRHAQIGALLMRRSTFPGPLRWNPALKRYQDVDFVVRYLLSVESWVHTPGFHVLYVLHGDPQITDSLPEGRQNRVMFDGLVDYWREARDIIPARNHSLVREAALSLAWIAARQSQGADARAMLGFSTEGPGALARLPRVGATIAVSIVPVRAFGWARRVKRWIRAGG